MRRRQQNPRNKYDDEEPIASRNNVASHLKGFRQSLPAVVIVILVLLLIILLYTFLGISTPGNSLLRANSGATKKREQRVIAIGDIHGDKKALVRALQLANVVNNNDDMTWIGGSDTVVQIGDLLNKASPRDEETLVYITKIASQAKAAGGKIIVTVGDHDLHNAPKLWHSIDELKASPFPSEMFHAAYIADRTLFVHGSLSKTVFDNAGKSIDKMNTEASSWLSGSGPKPKWIGQGDGPIWSRLYSDKKSDTDPHCDELVQLLKEVNVDRMVVGHTVRSEGISSICNGQVWRIDVGLSETETRAGKIGASEVLEFVVNNDANDDTNVSVRILNTDVKLKSWK